MIKTNEIDRLTKKGFMKCYKKNRPWFINHSKTLHDGYKFATQQHGIKDPKITKDQLAELLAESLNQYEPWSKFIRNNLPHDMKAKHYPLYTYPMARFVVYNNYAEITG